ncbi:cation:proton antiporter [Nocardia fluminea]|uniref:cation:proton antiporter n=1 Tax=Nocardia fluminea TaxID=134984 RepID=UPI003D12053E
MSPIVSLFWIALVAVVAPLLSRLVRGYLPDVVILLVAGAMVGPHVLGWASSAGGVDLVSELGLGMLFLLAGYELDPRLLRGRSGHTAWVVWIVCLLFAFVIVMVATNTSNSTRVAVAIALTSTALGTLLPILKQAGILDSRLGPAVMTHGAVGELGPIVAMSVLLTSRDAGSAVVVVVLFVVAAVVVGFVPVRMLDRMPDLGAGLAKLGGGTSQLPVRGVALLLLVLMVVAEVFDNTLPTGRERVEVALYAATGLPIIVAVTQVATQAGLLTADVASILVAAGATTVVVFPLVARLIGATEAKPVTPAHE